MGPRFFIAALGLSLAGAGFGPQLEVRGAPLRVLPEGGEPVLGFEATAMAEMGNALAESDAAQAAYEAALLDARAVEAREQERWSVIRDRWWRVGRCEQPTAAGGVAWDLQAEKYSGGLGISNAAWVEWGGLEFATNAGLAAPDEQMIVAERILAGTSRASWGCPVP